MFVSPRRYESVLEESVSPREKRAAHYMSARRYRVIGCLPASLDRRCSTGSQRRMSIVRSNRGKSRGFSISEKL